MFRRGTTRREVAGTLLLAAGGPALAQTRREGQWLITRTDYPPRLKAMMLSVVQAAMATDAVLQRSDIRAIRDYRDFLDGRARRASDALAQLQAVHAYVNTHVKRVEDYDLYSADDVWAPPVNTLTVGGDCEDIALVKYWGLRRLGFAAGDQYLVLGLSTLKGQPQGHAVLGVRSASRSVYVLDVLEPAVVSTDRLEHFEPAYALNTAGFWRVDYADRTGGDAWRLQFQLSMGGG